MGGLLLLMEAGQAQEAFEAASRGLQPPQAPALGSSREADLTLLAGLAAQAAAAEFRSQRHYELAARTLQQGLQLLQRMGQLPEQRRRLEQQLHDLVPYRVLDLISRDLGARDARQEGIELLDQLVQRRGGLEGEADPAFPAAEFDAFFRQIRTFLTVQEQLDLFGRWGDAGSAAATTLAAIAQTASGFVQRKPERIQAALSRLQAGPQAGQELVMAYQQLLLGRVEDARALLALAVSAGLCPASSAPAGDALAELCAGCRQWLQQAVLPNVRDIAAEEADLEAWFADRDVQAYIAQQDRIRARQTLPNSPESTAVNTWERLSDSTATDPSLDVDDDDDEDQPDLWAIRERVAARLPQLPSWSWAAGIAVGVLSLAAVAWFSLRPSGEQAGGGQRRSIPVQPSAATPATRNALPASSPAQTELPLTAAEPSETQLRQLLNAWLEAKAARLAGEVSGSDLQNLARPNLIRTLERQVADNKARGEREEIEATISSLTIEERSPQRVAAAVVLRYSDSRLDQSGQLLTRTPAGTLRNQYVFGRDGGIWRVAAFRPSS